MLHDVRGTKVSTLQVESIFLNVLETFLVLGKAPGLHHFPPTVAVPPACLPPLTSAVLLTCVSDAVLLTLLPGLVDDAHPHQRGQDNAAHHSDGEDAYSGPILPAARAG